MIHITRLASGALLIQRNELDIQIDAAAIPAVLPAIIASLADHGRAIGRAKLAGYEEGLIVGHANGVRETEDEYRKEAHEIAAGLTLLTVSATLAA